MARDELWIPIVLLVLIALCVEWAIYQRDAVVRLRRGLAARFGRRPVDDGQHFRATERGGDDN